MKVLLATDGSDYAEQSIRRFSLLPIKHSPSYEIVTVKSNQAYGLIHQDVYAELLRQEDARASESFKRAAAILEEANLKAVHIVRSGQPANEITRYAKEAMVDLIVVGAHGVSLLSRLLIGSTSETIARHAPCSVMIVREADRHQHAHGNIRRITIASDCSDADIQIAAQVNALGVSSDVQFQLISVIEHPYLLDPNSEYDAQMTRQVSQALDRLGENLEVNPSNIEKRVFEKTHVASCILSFINEHPTDMIVLGDKGRSAIGHFFIGSVSRYVLHHAHSSVMVARKKI